MKLFKQSFKELKNKFFHLFILEFLFVFANFFFLLFVKNKVKDYLSIIQNIPSGAAGKESIILSAGNTVQGALIFAFVVVPLVFILIWIIFQSLLWKNIKSNIKNVKNYYKSFAVFSFVLIALFLIIIYQFLGTEVSEYIDTSMIIIFLLMFIFYYHLIVFYITNKGNKLIEEIKFFNRFHFKRFFKLLPYTLLAFIISMSQFFLFLVLFTSYLINDFFFLPPVGIIVYLILIMLVNIWVKIVLNIRFSEIK